MTVNERYIKEENEKLKLCSSKLQDKNEKLVARNKKLNWSRNGIKELRDMQCIIGY